jgi:hypothetical protein
VAYPEDVFAMWTRDEYITFPNLPNDNIKVAIILKEKDESVADWEKIVSLSKQINFKNKHTREVVRVTCEYGLQMYHIFRSLFHLSAIKNRCSIETKKSYIKEYDDAWAALEILKAQYPNTCPSLYSKKEIRRTWPVVADKMVNEMR